MCAGQQLPSSSFFQWKLFTPPFLEIFIPDGHLCSGKTILNTEKYSMHVGVYSRNEKKDKFSSFQLFLSFKNSLFVCCCCCLFVNKTTTTNRQQQQQTDNNNKKRQQPNIRESKTCDSIFFYLFKTKQKKNLKNSKNKAKKTNFFCFKISLLSFRLQHFLFVFFFLTIIIIIIIIIWWFPIES